MTRVLQHKRMARSLVSGAGCQLETSVVPASSRSSSSSSASGAGSGAGSGPGSGSLPANAPPKTCATAAMLQRLMMGLAAVREPRLVRERFEEDLRSLVRARSVTFRHDAEDVERPNVVSFELPGSPVEGRSRLEAVFDPSHPADDRARQMLAAGAHVAGFLLEIERANGRWPLGCARSRTDGAAPLIGSSPAIRRVRDRIERVAATDFTALIEGPSNR